MSNGSDNTGSVMTILGLWVALLVPLLYFGSQIVASRFYPGYSFRTQSASELGSDRSERPSVLNSGTVLTGVATLIAAAVLPGALRRKGCSQWLAFLTGLAMMSMGAGAIWAGVFPLPDPRHNPKVIGIGAFLVPGIFAASVFKMRGAKLLKTYLFVNLLLFAALVPVMAGATGLDLSTYRGALQRIAAAVLYVPVGVMAASQLRSNRAPRAGRRRLAAKGTR